MTKFIVMESAAQVRGKMAQFGKYRRIAVVEIEGADKPKMISERARGVVRILAEWSPIHQGKTERSEYWVTKRWAEKMAAALNGEVVADAALAAELDNVLLGQRPERR